MADNLKIAFFLFGYFVFLREDMTNNFYDLMEHTQFFWPFNTSYRKIQWHLIHIRKDWNKYSYCVVYSVWKFPFLVILTFWWLTHDTLFFFSF